MHWSTTRASAGKEPSEDDEGGLSSGPEAPSPESYDSFEGLPPSDPVRADEYPSSSGSSDTTKSSTQASSPSPSSSTNPWTTIFNNIVSRNRENSGRDEGEASSPYDGLFDVPNPFETTGSSLEPAEGRRRIFGRGGDAALDLRQYRNEDLDQYRTGGQDRGGRWRLGYSRDSRKKADYSRLDPAEQRKWQELITGGMEALKGNSNFDQFAFRNDLLGTRQDGSGPGRPYLRRSWLGNQLGDGSSRLASIGEGPAADIDALELESTVDEAKQAMDMCMDEAELWAWAAKDIWGYDDVAFKQQQQQQQREEQVQKHKQDQQRQEGEQRREKQQQSETPEPEAVDPADQIAASEITTPTPTARFGIDTPFYAPVLHRLLIHFRDRLKAPASALCVPRITRALGPRSLVLGCTPELYTEAIRTQWFDLRDLRGCLETLKEAKETGILVRKRPGPDAAASSAVGEPVPTSTRSLIGLVQLIESDVRRSILGGKQIGAAGAGAGDLPQSLPNALPTGEGYGFGDELDDMGDRDYSQSDQNNDRYSSRRGPMTSAATATMIEVSSLPLVSREALRIAEDLAAIVGGPDGSGDSSRRRGGPSVNKRPVPSGRNILRRGQVKTKRGRVQDQGGPPRVSERFGLKDEPDHRRQPRGLMHEGGDMDDLTKSGASSARHPPGQPAGIDPVQSDTW